ncbi:MAG: hybrid sensor histidine kinase/response regulator [Bacteroidota bacterium]
MEKRDINITPYRIMIVDDDPLVIKTLEKLLFRKNYLFYSVSSGEEAIDSIRDIEPDMILLDVFMEGLTGFEVCEKLKNDGVTQRIPVIFLTSNDQTSEVLKGFKAGAVDYIVKPFNTEELLVRIQTHLDLKKAREDIKTMTAIKSRFFSIMTHDIKDALTGVKGVAEFLHQELKTNNIDLDEVKKLSDLLLTDSSDLYRFMSSLIKWDQIDQESRPPAHLPVSAAILASELTEEFSQAINKKQISLTTDFSQKSAPSYTDPEALKDSLREILSNAVKYTESGGAITFSSTKSNGTTVFTISDTGLGMEKEVVAHIFRLDTPHPKTIGTHNEKGVGLGLILCQALLKRIDGTITITSEKHKGTKVVVQIPDLG